MGLVDRLKSLVRHPTMTDAVFGRILFIRIARDPTESYWEAEWVFPPTGSAVDIALPGDESGPFPESRAFYLNIVNEFDSVLARAVPVLDRAWRTWKGRPLNDDLWKDVRLAGFAMENPEVRPGHWDIAFESVAGKWVGIMVPFIEDTPQEAVVDG